MDFETVVALGEVVGGDLLHDGNDRLALLEEFGGGPQAAVDLDLAGFEICDFQLEMDRNVGRCGNLRISRRLRRECVSSNGGAGVAWRGCFSNGAGAA